MTERPDLRIVQPPVDYDKRPIDVIEYTRQRSRRPTFGDGLRRLVADIRADPELAIICALAGFVGGVVAVLVPALVIGAWL